MVYYNQKNNTIYLSSIYSNIPNFKTDNCGNYLYIKKGNRQFGRIDITPENIKEKLEFVGYNVKTLDDINYYLPNNYKILDEIEEGKFLCTNGEILDDSYFDTLRGCCIGIPNVFIEKTRNKKGEIRYYIYNKLNKKKSYASVVRYLRMNNLPCNLEQFSPYFINEILPHMSTKTSYNTTIYDERDYYNTFTTENTKDIYSWLKKYNLYVNKSKEINTYYLYNHKNKDFKIRIQKKTLDYCYKYNIKPQEIIINNKKYKIEDILKWYEKNFIKINTISPKSRESTYSIRNGFFIKPCVTSHNNKYFLENLSRRYFTIMHKEYLEKLNFPKFKEVENKHFNYITKYGIYENTINKQKVSIDINKLVQSMVNASRKPHNIINIIGKDYYDFNYNRKKFKETDTIDDIIKTFNTIQSIIAPIINNLFDMNYPFKLTDNDIAYLKTLFKTRINKIAQKNKIETENKLLKENNMNRKKYYYYKKKYPTLNIQEIIDKYRERKSNGKIT